MPTLYPTIAVAKLLLVHAWLQGRSARAYRILRRGQRQLQCI